MTVTVYAPGLTVEVFDKPGEPPPPPPVALPPVVTKTIDLAKFISVAGWIGGAGRYERFQKMTVAVPDANGRAKVNAFGMDMVGGGLQIFWDGVKVVNIGGAWRRPVGADGLPLPAQRGPLPLSLVFETPDGVRSVVATADADPLASNLWFDVDLTTVAEGWYKATVTGCEADGWSVADGAVYVLKGATAAPHALCPSITASYECIHPPVAGNYVHQFAWVPTAHAPNYLALPERTYPPVTSLTREKLVSLEVGPSRLTDIHRPVCSAEGIWSCFHTQHYNFSDFERARPSQPVLDGRRGVATLAGLMHIEWGTAVVPTPPFNGPVDNAYFTDTWRFGKILMGGYRGEDRGKVITLAGYRHKSPPPYRARFDDPYQSVTTHNLELVGDWSAIPPARHGFRRLWGVAWDSRAFVIDTAAPPIPAEKDLQPHATWLDHTGDVMAAGIRVFLPDMGGNRICKLQFDPLSHATPPAVTEFVTNLSDVFDVIECGKGSGIIAASVRGQSRIVFVSMDDGTIVAEFPTPTPEGVAFQDGVLYYGSIVAKNIKKRPVTINGDVVTLGPEVVAVALQTPWQIDGNSGYVKFALSDGTFGVRGMIGVVSWTNQYNGLPILFLPGENVTTAINWAAASTPWAILKGPPSAPEGARSYQSCVGFGPGRMFAGTVQESLVQFSSVLPADAATPDVTAGYREWMARGLHLTHGFHGWGYGLPPPWGVSPAIDSYLTAYGHLKAA